MKITTNDFETLKGKELSGVTFVRDYLQLQFNPPPLLNVYTPVFIQIADRCIRSGEEEFANAIIGQINKEIADVEVIEEDALKLIFNDSSIIAISLKPVDYKGAEAITLFLSDHSMVVM